MQSSKTIRILGLSFFFLLLQANTEINSQTVITGIIKSEKQLTIKEISFEFPDYIHIRRKIPVLVDSLGNFRIEVILNHPTNLYLDFGNNMKKRMLFAFPGDSIFLKITANLFQSRFNLRNYYSNVIVKGSSKKINEDVAQFIIEHSTVLDWRKEESAVFTLKPIQYRSYVEQREVKLNTFLEEFNKTHRTCDEFKIWANNYIKFWSWNNLTEYVSKYPRYNKLNKDSFHNTLPEDYFNFLKELNLQNEKSEMSSTFYDFMENLYIKILRESSSGLNELDTKYFDDLFDRFNKNISQYHVQYFKDILLAKFYSRPLKSGDIQKITGIYQPGLIKDSALRMQLQELYNSKKE